MPIGEGVTVLKKIAQEVTDEYDTSESVQVNNHYKI